MQKNKCVKMVPAIMQYRTALRRLVMLSRFGSKPGLERIRKLAFALGNPQKNFRCILVAGTNGKGSTTAMLAKILHKAGYRVGSYFSPSVFSFRERIQVDGKWISKKEFAACAKKAFSHLPSLSQDPPTFFEVMTAIAFLYFSYKKVDYAVLEAGLGGRHDAVNICEPVLSIITSIGLEHTNVLGKTTSKIAREKAGIIRPLTPIVCLVKDKPALHVIKKISRKLGAKFYFARQKHSLLPPSAPFFQQANAACAAKAASILGISNSAISSALLSFSMPARWQKISNRPKIIIDCCHNPPAALALQKDLRKDFSKDKNSPRILLFSSMSDKDYRSTLSFLSPYFDFIVACRLPYKRAAKLEDLKAAALSASCKKGSKNHTRAFAISNPLSALKFCQMLASKKGRILICGSMYLLQFLFGEKEFRLTQ